MLCCTIFSQVNWELVISWCFAVQKSGYENLERKELKKPNLISERTFPLIKLELVDDPQAYGNQLMVCSKILVIKCLKERSKKPLIPLKVFSSENAFFSSQIFSESKKDKGSIHTSFSPLDSCHSNLYCKFLYERKEQKNLRIPNRPFHGYIMCFGEQYSVN